MKKLFISFMFAILLLTCSSVNIFAKNEAYLEVETFHKVLSKEKDEWNNTILAKGIKMLDVEDRHIGDLYRVLNGNKQNGYIIHIIGEGVVEAKFEGSDMLDEINNKVYYLFPGKFLTKNEIKNYSIAHDKSKKRGSGLGFHAIDLTYNFLFQLTDWDRRNISYTINISHVPDLAHKVVYESSSLYSSYIINDVPDYLNEVVTLGCAPTASAMLIAYYDNEWHNNMSILEGDDIITSQGIYRPKFSMQAQDNNGSYSSSVVESLINELADDMNTCLGTCNGTLDPEWSFGLSQYLDTHNHADFRAVLSPINDVILINGQYYPNTQTANEFYDYQDLIQTGNPAVLMVGAGQYGGGHAVLGIGYFQCQSSPGVIVYDNLTHGESWLSLTYVEYFGFIYD